MFHDRTHRLRRATATGVVVVALPLAGGCGNDESSPEPAAKPAAPSVDLGEKPYQITCRDLADERATVDWGRRATVTLAADTKLRRVTQMQATQRINFAMIELCKQNDGSYKPAKDAVAAVNRGEYRTGLG